MGRAEEMGRGNGMISGAAMVRAQGVGRGDKAKTFL